MLRYLITGTLLGLSAGLAPGPLLTLVIAETLRHGVRAGMKVALAPLVTDLPLIAVTLFLLARLADFHYILGLISVTGGAFVLFLGYENLSSQGLRLDEQQQAPRSLTKGLLANILSPYPYLFWFSVGAPLMIEAYASGLFAALAFLCAFYVSLVGSKILLAIAVGRSRAFLTGKQYLYSTRLIGFVLCVLAVGLFRDGLRLLGFWWE